MIRSCATKVLLFMQDRPKLQWVKLSLVRRKRVPDLVYYVFSSTRVSVVARDIGLVVGYCRMKVLNGVT